MIIAITGSTGNMGRQVLFSVLRAVDAEKVRLLVLPEDKRYKKLLKENRTYKKIIEVIKGNLADREACKRLVQGADYVINLASVIPPSSDKCPQKAVECNQYGVEALVSEIEKLDKQPKLIHISTVALYGNRNERHPWGRVGDPLLVSPYDVYAATKMRGEFRVLESSVKNWAVLRQTAMFHANMLSDNMSDGLMFHTCFNAPLEWVTAKDSGKLVANIIKADLSQDLSKSFWRKVFNIGAGANNRNTGYQTLDEGFKLIGGSGKDFFKPTYSATRNFHGVWFYDGDELNKLFDYQTQSIADYWAEMKKSHRIYGAAKIVPKALIAKVGVKRLFKNYNSPAYWFKHGKKEKLVAYFGGEENYRSLPEKWEDFPLLCESEDYDKLLDINNAQLVDLGFDYGKKDEELTIEDLRSVARAHGGKLLSEDFRGDMYEKMQWETQDGESFSATPFSVMRAGHWFNVTYKENAWDFDRLCKKDKIYASLWYDSHSADEGRSYYMDGEFNAKIK